MDLDANLSNNLGRISGPFPVSVFFTVTIARSPYPCKKSKY
jgi:hypothetical protein